MTHPFQVLPSVDPSQWITKQIVIIDWWDGPRAGLCELIHPACCFWFQIVAERFEDKKLTDALFRISIPHYGTMNELLEHLIDLGTPTSPSWCPIWLFPTTKSQTKASQYVNRLIKSLEQTKLLVQTYDMVSFSACWIDAPDMAYTGD